MNQPPLWRGNRSVASPEWGRARAPKGERRARGRRRVPKKACRKATLRRPVVESRRECREECGYEKKRGEEVGKPRGERRRVLPTGVEDERRADQGTHGTRKAVERTDGSHANALSRGVARAAHEPLNRGADDSHEGERAHEQGGKRPRSRKSHAEKREETDQEPDRDDPLGREAPRRFRQKPPLRERDREPERENGKADRLRRPAVTELRIKRNAGTGRRMSTSD